jgi:DNA repair protein RecO (recombination protein O)
MKQIETEAIILKRLNFGEADRILTVLTPQNGKISLIAKGVRKSKSKLAGGLELFSITEVSYIDGKSEIKTIVSTRLKTHFKLIVSDVSRTMIGYDFMKIVDFYTEHADEPAFYILLSTALHTLDDNVLPVSLAESWFYTKLLVINGSAINVEKSLNGEAFSDDALYDFSYEDMGFFINSDGQFSPKHIKFLRLIMRANTPKQLTSVVGYEPLSSDLNGIIKQSATMHKA